MQEEARFKFRALDFQYSDIDSETFSKMRLNMLGKKRYAAMSQEPVIESIPKRQGSVQNQSRNYVSLKTKLGFSQLQQAN